MLYKRYGNRILYIIIGIDQTCIKYGQNGAQPCLGRRADYNICFAGEVTRD